MQVLGSQDVPQRRLSQQPRRVVRVLHVGHRHRRVRHAVVDDGVHGHRDGVPREHLEICLEHHEYLWLVNSVVERLNIEMKLSSMQVL